MNECIFDCFSFLQVASQAAAIVAKTKYLSNSTLVSDGSAIGNILSALPGQIEATLGDQVCALVCLSKDFIFFSNFYYFRLQWDNLRKIALPLLLVSIAPISGLIFFGGGGGGVFFHDVSSIINLFLK